ncbi:MAG: hypothetical protein E7566_03005 [Ruminococcaceae bacterium]|nr:hypothetical protein [Oscillospiraceae bacterium]
MTIKRFFKLQIIFVLLLAVTIIGSTFSWANRPAVKGGGFMSNADDDYAAIKLVTPNYYVNGNSCTAVTYKGTRNEETGEITYDDEIEGNTPVAVTSFTDDDLTKGEVHYFKTVITNTAKVNTNVSLFISGYTANKSAAMLGVSTPITKSGGYPESFYDITTGLRYFDFVPVVSQYEIPAAADTGAASVKVEWSVFYNAVSEDSNNGAFHISDIILTNN